MQFLRRAYERFATLLHELLKFGIVGALAFVVDFGGTNFFRFGIGLGPLTSKVLGTVIAATFAYLGNRFWTYRHRQQNGLAREYVLFFVLNGVGLLPPLIVIGFVSYTLALHDPVAYNIAQIIGLVLGTLFRFWSYKKWVFLAAPEEPPVEGAAGVTPQAGPLTTR
ncbi:GtrA family protein [Planotetraspora thailandica]|uniref:GtrA family protein n=1 Tax=Planotetraspora thailandica TaxID=487172 RepID=UPI00194E1D1E|nr:GtrA family protein [Planotetraspora thailandica]